MVGVREEWDYVQEVRTASALSLLVFTLGCSGGEPDLPETRAEACAMVAGCDAPTVSYPGPRESIYRVLVVRSPDGAVRIEDVDEVEVSSAIGAPQGPLSGSHGIAGLDADGEPIEFQFLRFPDEVLLEDLGGSRARQTISLADLESSAVGYVRVDPALSELALIDAEGEIVARQTPPAPGTEVVPDGVGASRESLVQASAASGCSHVVVLEEGDDAWVPAYLRATYPLLSPTPLQFAVVRSALGRMSPMLCAGLSRIMFTDAGDTTTGGWVGTVGDLAFINVDVRYDGVGIDESSLVTPGARARLTHVLVHEAAHAAEFLLGDATDASERGGDWEETERSLAEATIENTRLRGGLRASLLKLHASFEALGWADPYAFVEGMSAAERSAAITRLVALAPNEVAELGAMSGYGSTAVHDDFAEMVAHPITEQVLTDGSAARGRFVASGCVAMRDYDDPSVPQQLAALYTKLRFVRDLGLISEDDFRRCAGPSIGLATVGEGITVLQGGEVQRLFANSPDAGIGTRDGRYLFSLSAGGTIERGGETHGATVTLRLDLADAETPLEHVSWPRGVYPLNLASPHVFALDSPTDPGANFFVEEGFALVTEATNDRLAGSVFVRLARRGGVGGIAPDTYDPPLIFRFLLTNEE